VVFGKVEGGMDVVLRMERVGSPSGAPTVPVEVADCGELPMDADLEEIANEDKMKRLAAEPPIQ
jgi:hypothetical protein